MLWLWSSILHSCTRSSAANPIPSECCSLEALFLEKTLFLEKILFLEKVLLLGKTLLLGNPGPHKPCSLKPQLPANPSMPISSLFPGPLDHPGPVQVPGVSSQAQPRWAAVFLSFVTTPPSGVGTARSSHKATSIPAPNTPVESIPVVLLSSRGAVAGAEFQIPARNSGPPTFEQGDI